MKQQVNDIAHFYSRFQVQQRDPETQVVASAEQLYLIREVRLQQQVQLEEVVETLQQHLTLSDQYLLTLQHYQLRNSQQHTTIRSIYQYSRPSLMEEIAMRKQQLLYFRSEELWTIMYSVVRALEYLQGLNIGYGVLGCDRIFLGQRVKLLDPSAIAEDPLLPNNSRLHSPEILLEYSEVDILKSDVFIFGLCLLQAALLIDFSPEFGRRIDETRIGIYLESVDQMYEPELGEMLRLMLEFNPDDRPTFAQIRHYLERTLDLAHPTQEDFNAVLAPDAEDEPNPLLAVEETAEYENVDVEAEETSPNTSGNLSEFERAKLRFLPECSPSLSRVSENSMRSSQGQPEKKKVSKSIKERLVKKMGSRDLEIVQVQQYGKEGLFTNPKLMADIQNELQSIARNRTNLSQLHSKENINRNY